MSSHLPSVVAPAGIPEGWAEATLGDIGLYHNGRGFKKTEWSDRGRPIIRIQNLTSPEKGFNYYEGDDVDERNVVRDGDILVSWAATLDVFRWGGPEAVLNQHIFKVESLIDSDFHFWLLKSVVADLYRQSHGSGMVHITRGRFLETRILLPPIAEQARIVEAIHRHVKAIDEALDEVQRAEEGLNQMRSSVLAAVVTGGLDYPKTGDDAHSLLEAILSRRRSAWEEGELGRLRARGKEPKDDAWKKRYKPPTEPAETPPIELPNGWVWATVDQLSTLVQYGTSAKAGTGVTGVPVLRMGNIVDGRLALDDLKYLPEEHEEFPELLLAEGDVLFNRTNSPELVGKSAVYSGDPSPCSFASYLIRVRLVEGVRPELLVYFLSSALGRAWIRSVVSQQVGQANVNGTKLKSLAIPLPPRGVQDVLCDAAEKHLAAIAQADATIASARRRARQLRRGVLDRALAGRPVAQDPADEHASVLLERLRLTRAEAGHGKAAATA